MDYASLIDAAKQARESAYAAYSGFTVGAALLCSNGKIYTGANIENASFGATNCAERTAFFTAVHNNEREFEAIAIAGAKQGEEIQDFCAPCGICRQVMAEFCDTDFKVLLIGKGDEIKTLTLSQILPYSFGKGNLE